MGRLVIWTESAFKMLPHIYGNNKHASPLKHGYHMPRPLMSNSGMISNFSLFFIETIYILKKTYLL